MTFVQNFPLFTIVLSLFCGVISFALPKKAARIVTYTLLSVALCLSASVLIYNLTSETGYFVYWMGHFPAPIGNEIAAGLLEPFFAILFEIVLLSAIIGGKKRIESDVDEKKQGFFYIMVDLVHVALIALCYTNDIFTAFVFVEICTIASCSLLLIRRTGRALVAATRYMIFSLVGSGLFLFGVVLLYSVTGQLLFPQLYEAVAKLWESGEYHLPLTVAIGLMVSGLCIKSGLFPFHLWMPDTYAAGTPAASSILSGVVSKGYIFLLLKVIYRAVGVGPFYGTGIQYLFLLFGIAGMILGSVSALHAKSLNFMIAFSSAAQIGYI
ncbi:MAG: sodium:proton antiporter, partial [Clostridia bacterium]|nr:sodium:proton antiporter [Clostridia bacterium]